MSLALQLSLLWILVVLGAWLGLPGTLSKRISSARRATFLVGGFALAVRLVPNFLLSGGAAYDIESYGIVGDLLLRGEDVYAASTTLGRHPYLPLQLYWIALARWSTHALGLPFVQIVRLAPIAADVGLALSLFTALRWRGLETASRGGLSYALNPIPVFVSAYHGQFDAIPALLTVLAILTVARSATISGGWLGLGILNKSWPVLALPSLLWGAEGMRRKLLFLTTAVLVPLAGLLLYTGLFHADPLSILRRATGYNHGVGIWGYSYFSRLLWALRPDLSGPLGWLASNGRFLTLTALALVWLLWARKEAPGAGILTILVSFFAITHAFSIQYLMWVVPFAILEQERRWLARYTLAAFGYMFLVYATLILAPLISTVIPWPQADWSVIMPAGLPAWLVTLAWAWSRLHRQRR